MAWESEAHGYLVTFLGFAESGTLRDLAGPSTLLISILSLSPLPPPPIAAHGLQGDRAGGEHRGSDRNFSGLSANF